MGWRDKRPHLLRLSKAPVSMKVHGISLLLLLLLTSAKCAKTDVLVVESKAVGLRNDKADEFDVSFKSRPGNGNTEDRMSWHAAGELIDAIKEFGYITRNVICYVFVCV